MQHSIARFDGSTEEIMESFLRLLYSTTLSASLRDALEGRSSPLSGDARTIVSTIDFDRLEVARRARVDQLHIYLSEQFEALMDSAPRDLIATIVAEFADSPCFWEPRGRTLGENFALYAHAQLVEQGHQVLADLTRLLGMISGISAWSKQPSPWPDLVEPPAVADALGGITTECVLTRSTLLDDEGSILRGSALTAANTQNSAPQAVFVVGFSDGSCVVGSRPVEVQR